MWLVLLAVALLLLIRPGCAALPPCEKFQAHAAIDTGGNPVIVFDMDEARKLGALIVGLAERTCSLPQ